MSFKIAVHNAFAALLAQKIERLQAELADLKAMGAGETKSTAGDKHETALAMIQLEQEKKREQLTNLQAQQGIFAKINPNNTSTKVVLGALVETNQGWFYVSTALGKVLTGSITVYAISLEAPLCKALQNHNGKTSFDFNSRSYQILAIS